MKDTIVISEEFRNYLERLNYEKNSRLNLITFMLDTSLDNKDMFNKLQIEYLEAYVQYELAKKELEQYYIYPKCKIFKSWNLDFLSREVTIYA